MKRAAAYLRSSKDRSDVSIDAQRRALAAMALSRGLTIEAEYIDVVESGKDDDRPDFQRLFADLQRPTRGWQTLLLLDTSRLSRRRYLHVAFEQEAERHGVTVIYKNVPDDDPITSMLLRAVLQAIDELHSLTSRQKGLAGMAENVRKGYRAGAPFATATATGRITRRSASPAAAAVCGYMRPKRRVSASIAILPGSRDACTAGTNSKGIIYLTP